MEQYLKVFFMCGRWVLDYVWGMVIRLCGEDLHKTMCGGGHQTMCGGWALDRVWGWTQDYLWEMVTRLCGEWTLEYV